jgi:L-threonylcarbamoyladenylate synthase
MKRIKITKENRKEAISEATKILSEGGIVIYPTETCYGIAVDATNENAVKKLAQYKSQRGSKPFSASFTDKEMASKYVEINDMAKNLYVNYLPGPITVISKSLGKVSPGVESINGNVGVRISSHEIAMSLVKEYGKPITATSANISYQNPPYDIDVLIKNTPKKSMEMVDLILDYGILPKNIPSTVVDTTLNSLKVLRAGAISFEEDISNDHIILQKETTSPEETASLAKEIISEGKFLIAMKGELGAGKTQLAKGVGEYLGVKEIVNSPTYTIINEYPYGDKILAHMDTWRVADSVELNRSGLENHLKDGDVVLVEWADKFWEEIAKLAKEYNYKVLKVVIEYIDLEKRKVTVYEE